MIRTILGFLLVSGTLSLPAAEPRFQDDFERKELGKAWTVHPNSFRIEDGVLIVATRPDADHGAVGETLVDFADGELEVRFKFMGSPQFNVVIDDKKYKESHAGHICRVSVRQNRILLQDDKTGAMRNDLFEKRRKSPKDPAIAKELAGKSKTVAVDLKKGEWHKLKVVLEGATMRVSLDGKEVASLTSEGIAHPTKTDFGFTVIDREVHFDDVVFR